MEKIENINKHESYDITQSYDDSENKCIHVPINYAEKDGAFYFDANTANFLATEISEKYRGLKEFTGKWGISSGWKKECMFFYK